MNIAQDFLDAMMPVRAVYARTPEEFGIQVAIQESDQAFRTSLRDQIIGSKSSGVILTDARIRRGGRLTVGDRVYRIDNVIASSVPGLSDLKLERIAGATLSVFDAVPHLPLDEEIEIGGQVVAAHINRSVEVEEIDGSGVRVVVARMMIAIPSAAAVGLGTGDKVCVDGRTRSIARVMDDGVGMTKLLI